MGSSREQAWHGYGCHDVRLTRATVAVENAVRKVSMLLIAASAVGLIMVGMRYMLADEFMPYHSQVAQVDWAELQPGVRTIILGMLVIIGSGFVACGAALLWGLFALQAGAWWARWSILTVGLLIGLPTLYVTLWLKASAPDAETPVGLTLVLLLAVLAGALIGWRASPRPAGS